MKVGRVVKHFWTNQEIETLRTMRTAGESFLTISNVVDHSQNSCVKIATKHFIAKGRTDEPRPHKMRSSGCKRAESNLGRYEVNNETIDLFLYGP